MTETYLLKLAIDDTALKALEQRLSKLLGVSSSGSTGGGGQNSNVAQNLIKLTAIATGVGSVVMLVKKIADATVASSPMLKAMLKLMDNSISLILRPIGDFFGFIMRPIMLLILQYVVLPFYRTFYPLAKQYGTIIGDFFAKDLRTIMNWFSQNPLLATILTATLAGLGLAGLFAGVNTAIGIASNNIVAAIKSVACPCDSGKGGGGSTPAPPVIPIPPLPPGNSSSPTKPQKQTNPFDPNTGILATGTTSTVSTKTSNTPIPNLGASSNTSAYQYLRNLATAPPVRNTSNNPDNSILAGNNPLLQRITAMEATISSWVSSGLQSLSSLPQALQKQLQAITPALGGVISRPILPDVFADTGSSNTPQVNVTIGGNIYGVNDLEKAISTAVQKSFNRGAH